MSKSVFKTIDSAPVGRSIIVTDGSTAAKVIGESYSFPDDRIFWLYDTDGRPFEEIDFMPTHWAEIDSNWSAEFLDEGFLHD